MRVECVGSRWEVVGTLDSLHYFFCLFLLFGGRKRWEYGKEAGMWKISGGKWGEKWPFG